MLSEHLSLHNISIAFNSLSFTVSMFLNAVLNLVIGFVIFVVFNYLGLPTFGIILGIIFIALFTFINMVSYLVRAEHKSRKSAIKITSCIFAVVVMIVAFGTYLN